MVCLLWNYGISLFLSLEAENIDSVPSHANSSRQEALLFVFEDNEADWLFDRINLDPKIQIKYIDTKNQLAVILTKGNFTRDE